MDPNIDETLETVADWSPMLRARRGETLSTDCPAGRYAATDLSTVGGEVPALVVARHAEARGLPVGRHAASLVFQRYCHRVAGLAVTTYALTGRVLDLRSPGMAMQFETGSPTQMLLGADVDWRAGSDVSVLLDAVVVHHLEPVAAAVGAAGGVRMPNLWGNIAASLAGGVRIASHHLGVRAMQALGERIAASHPRLSRGGSFRVVTDGPREGLFYDRASCCHWYAVPDGAYCSWCSRLTAEQRADRFTRALRDQA